MSRGYNQHQFITSKCLRLQFRWKHRCIPFHQTKIYSPIEHRLDDFMGVEDRNMQCNPWIASTKSRHYWWQEIHASNAAGRQRNFPLLHVAQEGQRRLHLALHSKDPASMTMQDAPGVRKGDASPVSFN